MRPAARYFAAGVVAVALGAAPAAAQAQSTSSTSSQGTTGTQSGTSSSGTSTTGSTSTTQTTSPSSSTSSTSSSSGGIDEAAAREHLSQARQALADLTKLPAATQLQGEQRTQIANFIQSFNAFATATTDWRSKFQAVEQQLDQILASADSSNTSSGTAGTTGSSATAATSSGSGATGATGASGTAAAAGYDATIISKLREVKTHLDAFQEASGDPTPHYDAIEKIIDSALNGGAAGSGSVGTSGTTSTGATGDASASGSVSLTRAQLEEIRQHVEKLRAASNAAMAKQ
jgi:hypothetical protein